MRRARPWWLRFQGFDIVALELPRSGCEVETDDDRAAASVNVRGRSNTECLGISNSRARRI
jgi:hypothetical protein